MTTPQIHTFTDSPGLLLCELFYLKPVMFVFHGGSGSDVSDIRKAIDYGVIKMNIDTDTQWAYWQGNCVSLTRWR